MRITKLQKELFDIQLEAAKKNFKGYPEVSITGLSKETARSVIKESLIAKKPIRGLWMALYENTSVTSQLIYNISSELSHITQSAEKIMRTQYKRLFNSLNIK